MSTNGSQTINGKSYDKLIVVAMHSKMQKNFYTYYFARDIGLVKVEGPGFTYELQLFLSVC